MQKSHIASALVLALLCMCGKPDSRHASSSVSDSSAVKTAGVAPPQKKKVSLTHELTILTEQIRSDFGEKSLPPSAELTRVIDSLSLALSSRLFMETSGKRIISDLNKIVFTEKRIAFDSAQDDIRTLFPQSVVTRKKGSCLGISLIYLCIAEKNEYPVYGVLIPRHFFVRFDNGSVRLNIEPMKAGGAQDDSWYKEKFSIPDSSWYDLKNLTKGEVLGVIRYNIANHYLMKRKYDKAAFLYHQTVDALPGFAEAWGNLGVASEASGKPDKAFEALEKARMINPSLKNIDSNMGALLIKLERFDEAATAYGRAIESSPGDAGAHYGLAVAHAGRQEFGQAAESARKALSLRPDFSSAQELLNKLAAQKDTP